MAKNILIVESPAKAKTIGQYLGEQFEVKSSFGHIRDLPKKQIGVDIDSGFVPTYEVPPEKKKIVSELKAAAKDATVWLASDEDREGEAIAWHICELLGLTPDKVRRIVFHEITKSAIDQAIAKPRAINQQLVDAQQARRVLDRLVGYELSPVLWKKVRTGLSAGRVQSVAVRLIVEREREIRAYEVDSHFKVSVIFEVGGQNLIAELADKLKTEAEARQFLEALSQAEFTVLSIDKRPGSRSPAAPFTTSTLQQEASRRLGFSVRQTMTVAQRLYESGHITYMRTDSTVLSTESLSAITKYISDQFGAKYLDQRQYQTKSRLAQEAHEAIRPTDPAKGSAGDDANQQKLYRLIWQRAIASQMANAKTEKTEVKISLNNRAEVLSANGEILSFDGWLKVYGGIRDDKILPPLKLGDKLQLQSALATETFGRAPARYSEASLVRKLEELGIGRPSTYAPTISTIQDRGYIEKGDVAGESKKALQLKLEAGQLSRSEQDLIYGADRNKLMPTELAEVVIDFLSKYFSSIIDYDFTARAEEDFDDIAQGRQDWQKAIAAFYERFHPLVEKSEAVSRAEAVKARELGKHPKSGEPIIVRFGRFGPVLQHGASPDPKDKKAKKPQFAPLPAGASLDNVTLDQALPMFELPRLVGQSKDGQEILANIGPYGPYLKVGKQFVSLKDYEPHSITEAQARAVIEAQAQQKQNKEIANFGTIKILNGPYGPYVTDGKKNARVPKGLAADKLDQAAAEEILAKAPIRKFRRFGKTPKK